jgi:L-lactate dehydrogenase (cytochrome)
MVDSGIRSGLDVVRAIALGAKAVLAGRPFLFGVAALGPAGARHAGEIFIEEIRMAMGQIGAPNVEEIARMVRVEPGWRR